MEHCVFIDELFLGWMNLVATTKLQVKRFIKLAHISRNTLFICWHTGVVLFIAVVKEIWKIYWLFLNAVSQENVW